MTLSRFLTSIALVSIGFSVIYFGGLPLLIWTALVAVLATYEIANLFKSKDLDPYRWVLYPAVLAAILSTALPTTQAFWYSKPMASVIFFLIIIYLVELILKRPLIPNTRIMATAKIFIFIASTFPYIYLIRALPNGLFYMAFCCVLIWACDSLALLGGRKWGKTPLSPLSPKKTIEGAMIGTVGALIITIIWISIKGLPTTYIPLALLVVFLAQTGDLHESLIKRFFDVKDTSNILPGHGGIYDRADSTLFVVPIMTFLFLAT